MAGFVLRFGDPAPPMPIPAVGIKRLAGDKIAGATPAVIGITCAVYPAWRAALISPMKALRHE